MSESPKDKISYSEFEKLDIRIGLILDAEPIPKSRNLVKLKVDIGEPEPRQILAGIAGYYKPEELKNRKIVVLANLEPRKLMGLESNGMLLAADVNNQPFLLKVPDDAAEKIAPGSKVR
jgi:methionyl-tRNA synthetase